MECTEQATLFEVSSVDISAGCNVSAERRIDSDLLQKRQVRIPFGGLEIDARPLSADGMTWERLKLPNS